MSEKERYSTRKIVYNNPILASEMREFDMESRSSHDTIIRPDKTTILTPEKPGLPNLATAPEKNPGNTAPPPPKAKSGTPESITVKSDSQAFTELVARSETGKPAQTGISEPIVQTEEPNAFEKACDNIEDYFKTGDMLLTRYAPENRKRIMTLGAIISVSDAGLKTLEHIRRKFRHDKNPVALGIEGAKDVYHALKGPSEEQIQDFFAIVTEHQLWQELKPEEQQRFFTITTAFFKHIAKNSGTAETSVSPIDQADAKTKEKYVRLTREVLQGLKGNRIPSSLNRLAAEKMLDATALIYSKEFDSDYLKQRVGQILQSVNWKSLKDRQNLKTRATDFISNLQTIDSERLKAFFNDHVKQKALYPLYVEAADLLLTKIKSRASSAMDREFLQVKHNLNVRIANSLLMRDFEFTGDQSPMVFMNHVRLSKDATEALLKTYTDILPTAISFAGMFMPAFSSGNLITPLLTAARLSAAYFKTESRGKARKAVKPQDFFSQRWEPHEDEILLNRIISGLELAKTSPSLDTKAHELSEALDTGDKRRLEQNEDGIKNHRQKPLNPLKRIRQYVDLYTEHLQNESYLAELITQGAGILHVASEYWMPTKKILLETPSMTVHEMLSRPATQTDAKKKITAGREIWSNMRLKYNAGIKDLRMAENDLRILQTKLKNIKKQLKHVHDLESLLGPYDPTDTPDGPKEQSRISTRDLANHTISIRNLNFKEILREVSLDIPQGSVVTIKGRSGTGKTTLIRHMLGLYKSNPGAVTYGGVDLHEIKKYSEDSIYSIIGYAHQEPRLFSELTLRENLTLWTPNHITDEQIRGVMNDLYLDKFTDRLDDKVKNMSGGERRRISIARAILRNPKILFLDEPLANLDEESSNQVLSIVQKLHQQNPDMTIVGITHDKMFEGIADKTINLSEINGVTRGEDKSNVVYFASAKPDTTASGTTVPE